MKNDGGQGDLFTNTGEVNLPAMPEMEVEQEWTALSEEEKRTRLETICKEHEIFLELIEVDSNAADGFLRVMPGIIAMLPPGVILYTLGENLRSALMKAKSDRERLRLEIVRDARHKTGAVWHDGHRGGAVGDTTVGDGRYFDGKMAAAGERR